jgi:hypothetical protein
MMPQFQYTTGMSVSGILGFIVMQGFICMSSVSSNRHCWHCETFVYVYGTGRFCAAFVVTLEQLMEIVGGMRNPP